MKKKQKTVPAYRALRVIDGDTFETTERQLIRLTGVDAPEMGRCDSKEAKEKLEELLMGKNLYIKAIYRDGLNRWLAHVYNDKGLISTQMAEAGLVYRTGSGIKDNALDNALDEARDKKLGVYSEKCTHTENKEASNCVIKGNLRKGSKSKYYHFPGCGEYKSTIVQLALGDEWFCTEKEAQKAGFTKGSDCFEKVWK